MSAELAPFLTETMTPEQLKAFEDKYLTENFYLENGQMARSGLFHLGEGSFVRLYALIPSDGGDAMPRRFFASTYTAATYENADGKPALLDNCAALAPEYKAFTFKGKTIPKLASLQDMLQVIGRTVVQLMRLGKYSKHTLTRGLVDPVDEFGNRVHFAKDLFVEREETIKQVGRGTMKKLSIQPTHLPSPKVH